MCDHAFDDDLSDLIGSPMRSMAAVDKPLPETTKAFEEPCEKCGGSGKFRGYSGRIVGDCFTCKGSGRKTFKTSADQREKARVQRAERKERHREEDAAMFRQANPELVAYLEQKASDNHARGGTFDFPAKMLAAIKQWGDLTDGQRAAVEKMMARDVERAKERTATKAAARTDDLDVSLIQAAFDRAIADAQRDPHAEGIKWLRMRFEGLAFSPAGPRSRNPGAIYVTDTTRTDAQGKSVYLGKVVGGKFHRSRDCNDELVAKIAEIAKDPAAAAKAYGLKFSHCSICGRELTDPESRARGIGPICAGRFGF